MRHSHEAHNEGAMPSMSDAIPSTKDIIAMPYVAWRHGGCHMRHELGISGADVTDVTHTHTLSPRSSHHTLMHASQPLHQSLHP